MIRYHIFDFDGTIADSMYTWNKGRTDILHSYGKEPLPGLDIRCAPLNLEDTAGLLKQEYDLPASQETVTRQLTEALEREYFYKVPAKPGIEEVLKKLKKAGVHLCVATGSPGYLVETALKRLGLFDYFEFVLPVWTGASKHKPDIYLKALEMMGGSDPAGCAVYEDSITCVKTALAAGFTVYGMLTKENVEKQPEIRALAKQALATWEGFEPDIE